MGESNSCPKLTNDQEKKEKLVVGKIVNDGHNYHDKLANVPFNLEAYNVSVIR
jgi:hypothetical protein